MQSGALVKLKHIGVTFNDKKILSDISLEVRANKIITLIGPNGSGKTTLIRVMLGLEERYTGQRNTKPNLSIGYMPQSLHLNSNMPLTVNKFLSLTTSSPTNILRSLERTGIAHASKQIIHFLSGGEKQRVLLARAILHNPDLLILDEPVQGIDLNGQKELYKLITTIRDEQKCGIVMVSHDLHLVIASTDLVYCINGHICCSGHPENIQNHPAYLELLGEESNLAIYTHHHNHNHSVSGEILSRKQPIQPNSNA